MHHMPGKRTYLYYYFICYSLYNVKVMGYAGAHPKSYSFTSTIWYCIINSCCCINSFCQSSFPIVAVCFADKHSSKGIDLPYIFGIFTLHLSANVSLLGVFCQQENILILMKHISAGDSIGTKINAPKKHTFYSSLL